MIVQAMATVLRAREIGPSAGCIRLLHLLLELSEVPGRHGPAVAGLAARCHELLRQGDAAALLCPLLLARFVTLVGEGLDVPAGRLPLALTEAGVRLARQTLPGRPYWDRAEGLVWLDGARLKRVRPEAVGQWLLLDAFESQGWPGRVRLPLPGTARGGGTRLAHAIRGLNGSQTPRRVEFHDDGDGWLSWHEIRATDGKGLAD
jgi:hypothetical protein